MRQSTYVRLGLLAFGLILATFVVRGTTRLVIGDRTSMLLSLPFGLAALALLCLLFALAMLSVTRLRPIEPDGE
ncbi:hypothetical protein [Natronorarus salvus]|uniref:hypothetical protein n=1 Tax=Natronorarus salvus TaxID=3117733 RepID=UPI002F26B947